MRGGTAVESYRTVQGTAEAELEDRRSLFIAQLSFADTEEKALAFLDAVRAKHKTASHNVYAYVPVSYTHLAFYWALCARAIISLAAL